MSFAAEEIRPLIREVIKEYEKGREKQERRIERKYDKGAKVKKMLSGYRRTKAALKNEVELTTEEKKDLRWHFIEDLMGNPNSETNPTESLVTENVKRRREKLYCIRCIDAAVELYKEECELSGSEEYNRRFREMYALYIGEPPTTVKEISAIENVSEKTVYKDVKIACDILAVYLLQTP